MSYNLEQYNNNTFVTIQRYDTFDTVCQKCKIIAIVKTGINSFIGIWLYFICSKLNIIGKTLIGVHKWSHRQCNAKQLQWNKEPKESLLPVIEMLGWRQNLKELDKGNIKLLSYCHHYQNNCGWRPRDILSLEQCNLNISRGWELYNSYLLSPIIHQRFPYSFSSFHPTASLCW